METKIKRSRYAVLSLSGGMDSSTLLLHLLANGYEVCALSFDYGQKHNIELERAKELVQYLNNHSRYEDEQYYAKIKHQVITLKGLDKLLDSALVKGGNEVPEGHYAEDNMKATVVPNRNKIFSSLIQAVALSIAQQKNEMCAIAMGIHSGDHAIYPDCREEFRDADFKAFKLGNWGAEKVFLYTPYLEGDKFSILQDGVKCCEYLHLNFDKVYAKTNTSYKPIKHKIEFNNATETWYEEEWFSDYKSASSVERVEAFMKLGRKDPVQYADEFGPVAWDYVVSYVSSIIEKHEKSI
jgi:7-cyano-7-deazaguanine synthase